MFRGLSRVGAGLWLFGIVGRLAGESSTNVVQFWPPPGTYTNFLGIMLSAAAGSARYTLNGSAPDASSPAYWDPILVTGPTTVKAAAYKDGMREGPVCCASYQILTNAEAMFNSALPILVINSQGTPLGRERKATWITLFGASNRVGSLTGPVEYSGRAAVGIRGSSSRGMPKKPYRIELQDEQGHDLKAPLLGMPRESDWVLLASYTDRTFIRDPLAYELWRQMGHYAPRFRFVEVFIVETNRAATLIEPAEYRGIYLLVEKPKRGKQRIAVQKLSAADRAEPAITGGYIFKKDRPTPGEAGFKTKRLGLEFVLEEPKERDISEEQREWLLDYLNSFEEALFNPDPKEASCADYIDMESFIDFHWMVEISCNPDGYGYSVFFEKDRNQPLRIGPIWDSDLSFGNLLSHGRLHVDQWQWRQIHYPLYQWYDRLFEDPDFLQLYIDRWNQLREGILAETNIVAMIEKLAAQPRLAQARNFQRWPALSPNVHANQLLGSSHDAQVAALQRWLLARLEWIDGQCLGPPRLSIFRRQDTLTLVAHGDLGTIYYTIGGSDPRLSGGQVSPRASRYDGPLPISAEASILARLRSPFGLWSAPVSLSPGEITEVQ